MKQFKKPVHAEPVVDEHIGEYWIICDEDGHIYDDEKSINELCEIINSKVKGYPLND